MLVQAHQTKTMWAGGVPHTQSDVLAASTQDAAGGEAGQRINAAADASRVGGLALAILGDGVCEAGPRTLGDGGQVLGEDGGNEAGGEESDLHFERGAGETGGLSELGACNGCVTEMSKERSDQSVLEWASLNIVEKEQRVICRRPDREYLTTYIAPPESNHQAPGLGPAIVFTSSIGAPL